MEIVTQTRIAEANMIARQKSREIYALSDDTLLVVYTDRMEAWDVLLKEPVAYKGAMLNQITNFWMSKFSHFVSNYRLTSKLDGFPQLEPYKSKLAGRSLLARRIRTLPIHFVTVGSLGGAMWQEYKETGKVNGQYIVKGLEESEWMDQPVVIPMPAGDASQSGGDGRKWAQRLIGQNLYSQIEEYCLAIFGVARNYAAARGLTLADTRIEFGLEGPSPILVNELLTPDMSTYWPGDVMPGESKFNFERQNLYGWLTVQRWKPTQPQPDLPPALVKETVKKYQYIYEVMTGKVETLKRQEEDLPEAEEV